MQIYYELDLDTFEAWSGGEDTLDRIRRAGKTRELESILEDLYPTGISKTELNDLLWFKSEEIFNWLGIRTIEDIKEELEEVKEELENLFDDYASDSEELNEQEAGELYDDCYRDNILKLESQIEDLEAELEEAV